MKNKTKKEYENFLNGLFTYEDIYFNHPYLLRKGNRGANKLAESGLYGTLLKKFDPIAFNVGFNEWEK